MSDNWDDYPDYISKSRLSTYAFCPLQYRKKYIDKVIPQVANYAVTVGSRFHNFAERFFEVAPDYPPEMWSDFIHEDFTPNEKQMLQWFINQERERLDLYDGDFDLWMPQVREGKFINHEHGLRGIVDRIDVLDDTFIIVEYKTSKSIYKPSLQGEFGFYVLLLQAYEQYKGKKFVGCVVNPRLGEIQFMSPSRETTILKRIDTLKKSIELDRFPPTCMESKMAYCGACSIEEAGLYTKI